MVVVILLFKFENIEQLDFPKVIVFKFKLIIKKSFCVYFFFVISSRDLASESMKA